MSARALLVAIGSLLLMTPIGCSGSEDVPSSEPQYEFAAPGTMPPSGAPRPGPTKGADTEPTTPPAGDTSDVISDHPEVVLLVNGDVDLPADLAWPTGGPDADPSSPNAAVRPAGRGAVRPAPPCARPGRSSAPPR